jgi:GH15 family glucan-1,4-alpha-glucosidase
MPRPLVFSNGAFFIGIDARYAIRDLFYPQVGRWNHLSGHPIRMGVWVDGKFSWVHEKGWTYDFKYKPGSLNGHVHLVNQDLAIEIETHEAISHRENWFVRCLDIKNLSPKPVEVKLFFSHDLRIMETDIGDTAFYHPEMDGIVHYKGPCYFLFGGCTETGGLDQYATGLKGFKDFEGTWRDAEDGSLSMNPISQGSVDSTIGFRVQIAGNATKPVEYWILASDDLEKLEKSYHEFRVHESTHRVESTHDHWFAWSRFARERVSLLPEAVQHECEASLLLTRAHIDNGGAIIAALDSDIMETNRANYCYMWPRDGALISAVLDAAGQHHLPRAFFEFCSRILPSHPPVLRQKYTADGKLGATWHPWLAEGKAHVPFQEDETALMISAMWDHHVAFNDLDALAKHFGRFVKPAATFLAEYRDEATGLPNPSYDLWEERYGIHAHTVATVICGLEAAGKIARELNEDANGFDSAANHMREGLQRLVDPQSGVFLRRLIVEGGKLKPDHVVDAATLHVGLMGVLPPDDPRVVATAKRVEERLWIPGRGGLARYEGDYYFRRYDDLPGNPWIICTCWLAQHYIQSAKAAKDLEKPLSMLEWVCEQATSTGVLPEQLDPRTGEHLSVSPLTWSHAEFVKTCFDFVGKLGELHS